MNLLYELLHESLKLFLLGDMLVPHLSRVDIGVYSTWPRAFNCQLSYTSDLRDCLEVADIVHNNRTTRLWQLKCLSSLAQSYCARDSWPDRACKCMHWHLKKCNCTGRVYICREAQVFRIFEDHRGRSSSKNREYGNDGRDAACIVSNRILCTKWLWIPERSRSELSTLLARSLREL